MMGNLNKLNLLFRSFVIVSLHNNHDTFWLSYFRRQHIKLGFISDITGDGGHVL